MTSKETPTRTETDAVADLMRAHFKPEILSVTGQDERCATQILVLTNKMGGLEAHSLKKFGDEYATRPERRKGEARLTDLDSLIAHINRFKDADTALFACDNRDNPALTAVLDYHPAGADSDPRFGTHRAVYKFPLSDEWKAWREVDGVEAAQLYFAEFIEDRIVDVLAPPTFLTAQAPVAATTTNKKTTRDQTGGDLSDADQRLFDLVSVIGGKVCGAAKLMELSRGLRIHDKQTVQEIHNTSSGESALKFQSEHQDAEGKAINVPNMFLIAIPVFRNGAPYRIPVRLRYRLSNGGIKWRLTLHRPDIFQDDAFTEAVNRARDATDCPLFIGAPEEAG